MSKLPRNKRQPFLSEIWLFQILLLLGVERDVKKAGCVREEEVQQDRDLCVRDTEGAYPVANMPSAIGHGRVAAAASVLSAV